ncbi:MAG: hypothetical protein WC178_04550 [Candidatus Paceibacterota bacterium]
MDIKNWLRNKLQKWLGGAIELPDNPKSQRYTFINDDEAIRELNTYSYFVWYSGSSDELLNFYTDNMVQGFYKNPIYNRNNKNYFWALSVSEEKIKRTTSGIARAITDTLVNAIGYPKISTKKQYVLDTILNDNDFRTMMNQKQMPFTLVGGTGAYKIDINLELSKHPIVSYYDATKCEIIKVKDRVVAIVFKDYYTYGQKEYLLLDIRRVENYTSIVEYELYELKEYSSGVREQNQVPLSTLPDLKRLKAFQINGYNHLLAVPTEFFYDERGFGRSIYAGKVDLFDDLDQCLSQSANTVRKSTPIEYYPDDLLERDSKGNAKIPARYDRTYVKGPVNRNGDGTEVGEIKTTQPVLNFEQYSTEAISIVSMILNGVLSPATMGIDVAKKDNSDAQREKEKVTIMTRNNIIAKEQKIIAELCNILLAVQEYIDFPNKPNWEENDVTVQFSTFANPSFENELVILGQALSGNGISPKLYVDKLYGDTLTNDEKAYEEKYIDEALHKQQTAFSQVGSVATQKSELENTYDSNRNENTDMDGSRGVDGGVAKSNVANQR